MTCVVVARVVFEMCDCHQSIKYDMCGCCQGGI